MKRINILLGFLLLVIACKGQENQQKEENNDNMALNYDVFGDNITAKNAISAKDMAKTYDALKVSDTVQTKFRAIVSDVCQAKGCWMKVKLKDGQESMIRFKDYGFFVPMDITGKEVIVNGAAFVASMSVEDQRHYAKDGGRSEVEIAKITEPKKTYSFEADGVLLAKE